jgi:CRP-like cAMP-binding protein
MDLQSLKTLSNAIHPLKEEEWEAFSSIWKPFVLKRKELITAKGNVESHLYFIEHGVQRVYALDEKDREATLVFTYPFSFGGSLDSFLLQKPSAYFYETLTPTEGFKASHSELDRLMLRYPSLERMIRLGISAALSGILERLVELQTFSSEEKLRALLKRSPHILQLVPHKYLANYLGIDPTNFSKLLNSVRM